MVRYYFALGRFVTTFATVEDVMLGLLAHVANTKGNDTQALFSGTRVRDAIKFIRRLHEARRQEPPAYLDDAFKQLSAINTARDQILHWGTRPDGEGSLLVTNLIRAHAERALVAMPISEDIINRMSVDLETIIGRAVKYALAVASAKPEPGHEVVLKNGERTWLYTPAQLKTNGLLLGPPTQEP